MASADRGPGIAVEVVLAFPDRQALRRLTLPAGATVETAIATSGLAADFPEIDVSACDIAVWGRLAAYTDVLSSGDRVELLRPLEIDPRDARRQLATAGQTMGRGRPGDTS